VSCIAFQVASVNAGFSNHTPADEFDESWSFAGALEDAQLVVGVVEAVASQGAPPSYKPGSEFAGLR
jgi:hypothetical protein